MAARLPRRSFAAPFVIVSSLAACHKDKPFEPIHENPPCCAPADAAAPEPQVQPQPAPPPVTPPVTPTPPPPVTHTINPPPPPHDPANRWSVNREHGKCRAFSDFSCGHTPPGQTPPPCNPPAPITLACPPQLTKDGAFVKIVQQDAGGDCRIDTDQVDCPQR